MFLHVLVENGMVQNETSPLSLYAKVENNIFLIFLWQRVELSKSSSKHRLYLNVLKKGKIKQVVKKRAT